MCGVHPQAPPSLEALGSLSCSIRLRSQQVSEEGKLWLAGVGGCFLAVNQVCCAPEAPKQFPPPAQGPPWLLLRNLAHHRHLLNVH